MVGKGTSDSGTDPVRWTSSGGISSIPYCLTLYASGTVAGANGISSDGTVIVGNAQSSQGIQGFYWTAGGGMEPLPDIAGGDFDCRTSNVSGDGLVAVGLGTSSVGEEAVVWKRISGDWTVTSLGAPSDGLSEARAASQDGSVVVGYDQTSVHQAWRWTEVTGRVALPDLAGGSTYCYAEDVTPDGSVIVGLGQSADGSHAVAWKQDTGGNWVASDLGDLLGGTVWSEAHGVSADGSIVVGTANTGIGLEAFIWDQTNGMRNLRQVLVDEYSLDLTGWTLTVARGISADGRTIIGYGINPLGNAEGWVATIPEPATLSLVAVGIGALIMRRRRK